MVDLNANYDALIVYTKNSDIQKILPNCSFD